MRRSRIQGDLDLTPLIDVLFMLIIFFVLTASFVQGQIPVDLPKGQGEAMAPVSSVIALDKDGQIYFDGVKVSLEEIGKRAKDAEDAGKSLLLTADRSIDYGKVASILDVLRSEGTKSVNLGLRGNEP